MRVARLAAAVLREVLASGVKLPFAERDTESAVAAAMWEPRYVELVPVDHRSAVNPAKGSAPPKPGTRAR